MREIVLDTETTGLDPQDGHRLVEIGGIELFNCIPTGQIFHRYIRSATCLAPLTRCTGCRASS
jgi:DNA polymerase III epsilon subunit-like protein